MRKIHLVKNICGKITLQGQLLTIGDRNFQNCLQIFVKLMHYFTFANFFIINFKLDIKFKLARFLLIIDTGNLMMKMFHLLESFLNSNKAKIGSYPILSVWVFE